MNKELYLKQALHLVLSLLSSIPTTAHMQYHIASSISELLLAQVMWNELLTVTDIGCSSTTAEVALASLFLPGALHASADHATLLTRSICSGSLAGCIIRVAVCDEELMFHFLVGTLKTVSHGLEQRKCGI